jgi:rhamnosyltransferase subunit B
VRIIASAYGSAGDFVPTLGIAAVLARRGHRVHFVGNPFHEGRVRSAGVDFVAAGQPVDLYAAIAADPRYIETTSFWRLFDEIGAPVGVEIYRRTRDLVRAEGADLVLSADVNFGAHWAADELGIATAVVYATPVAWAQRRAPLVVGDLPLPRWIAGPATAVGKTVVQWNLARIMRRLARASGAGGSGRSYLQLLRDAALHLGMWSPALRGPLPGDPAAAQLCGFVRGSALGDEQPAVPEAVEQFLAAGPPPVVIGLGSVFALATGELLECLTLACVELGQRCLVIGHPPGARFPSGVRAVPYAPYDQVFPRASVVVVHGGAGTTGEALRSGRPVLGVPFAFDQFTLCEWMQRLGIGRRVALRGRDVATLVSSLRRLLSDRAIAGRAIEVGARLGAERDGAEVAADAIERVGHLGR